MSSKGRNRCSIALLLWAAGAAPLLAQPAQDCADPKAHQFDFWIGEWEVFERGKLAGTNSIQPILDGCVLQEMWSGVEGSAGSSLNFYNSRSGMWQQFWVWRNGTILELAGEFQEGKMTLAGESVTREGEPIRNRITWYDNPDGSVRQHWQISRDRGESWETVFDGLYRRKP